MIQVKGSRALRSTLEMEFRCIERTFVSTLICNRELAMTVNMESPERLARIVAGLALLGVVLLAPGSWRWVGLIGVVPFATGLLGWCPLYALLARD